MISELLKTASEDAENEAKLAFVYEVMEDKEIGQEVTEEVENIIEEVEEVLEKTSSFKKILGNPATGLGVGLIGGGAIGYGVKKKMDESTFKKKDRAIQGLSALNYALMDKNQLAGVRVKNAYVEETLEKSAGIRESVFGSILGNAAGAAHGLSKLKPYAQAGAVGAAGIVGSALVNDLYSAARLAVTRNRNFKNMLEADPELKEHPAEKVKALFNTLHEKGGPEMSGDPLIASAFVKQQLELPPQFLLESVHKLVGTGSTLAKSKQMGSFDLSRMMRGDGQDAAKQIGKSVAKTMLSGPKARDIGGERCPVCGSNDVTMSNKGGLIFSDCEDCHHTW